jgi:transposase
MEKVWVYGALRVDDGQVITLTASSRNTAGYLQLLTALVEANPTGTLNIVMDNLSSHTSAPVREWLTCHPRVAQVPIPTGACWLNLQEGWWRLFRKEAFAGQTFADAAEITQATALATRHLNRRAKPWVWGRPAPRHRHLRRCFTYRL